LEYVTRPVKRIQAIAACCPCNYFYTRHQYIEKIKLNIHVIIKTTYPVLRAFNSFSPQYIGQH